MSDILAKDLRAQYDKAFATIKGILEVFPEGAWLEPHGDEYFIPCRIAYHLAEFTDNLIAGGYKDPDFASNLPYGVWYTATADDLPRKNEFIAYFDAVVERAKEALSTLSDDDLTAPVEPERAGMGASQLGSHITMLRELSAHTGEMNKMLVENGEQDVWVF